MRRVHNYYTGSEYGNRAFDLEVGRDYVGVTIVGYMEGVLLYDPAKNRLIFAKSKDGFIVPPVVEKSKNTSDPSKDSANDFTVFMLNMFVIHYGVDRLEANRVIPSEEIENFMKTVHSDGFDDGEVIVDYSKSKDKILILRLGDVNPKPYKRLLKPLYKTHEVDGEEYGENTHQKQIYINPNFATEDRESLLDEGFSIFNAPSIAAVIIFENKERDSVSMVFDNIDLENTIMVSYSKENEVSTPLRSNKSSTYTDLMKLIDECVSYDDEENMFVIETRDKMDVSDVVNIITAADLLGRKIKSSEGDKTIELSGKYIESRIKIIRYKGDDDSIVVGGEGFTIDDVRTIMSDRSLGSDDSSVIESIYDITGEEIDEEEEMEAYYHRDGITVHDTVSFPTFYILDDVIEDSVAKTSVVYDGILAGYFVSRDDEYYISLIDSSQKLVLVIESSDEEYRKFKSTGVMPRSVGGAKITNEEFYVDLHSVNIPEAIVDYMLTENI